MYIKFSPVLKEEIIIYKKINENTISINNEEIFFPDDLSEYDVSETKEIIKAYRDDENILFIELVMPYSEKETKVWENPNYYSEGGYRGSKFENFTDLENGSDIK